MKISRRIKPSHLRLVVAIADHEQLGLAADHLAISQPSASRSLAELESLLDAELFIRRTKWMEPTEAGKALIRHGRNVLAELESLELAFDNAVLGYTGHVRVGTVTGPAAGFVIPGLSKVQERYPNIELSVEVSPSTALIRGLKEGTLDFIVGRLSPSDDVRDFDLAPVSSEVATLCVGQGHPLFNATEVNFRELSVYQWVMQERGSPIRQAVESAFLQKNLKPPQNVTNASALLVMLSFLSQSNAIVPLSQEVFDMLSSGSIGANIKELPIKEKIIVPPSSLIRMNNAHLSKAAQQVYRIVKESMSE